MKIVGKASLVLTDAAIDLFAEALGPGRVHTTSQIERILGGCLAACSITVDEDELRKALGFKETKELTDLRDMRDVLRLLINGGMT